jgi:hypothetical protein
VEKDEAFYRNRLARAGVPEHMHDSYVRYLLEGIPPGSFLTAVLENNLSEACGRADTTNRRTLFEHVMFLYNDAPFDCWGSPVNVSEWIRQCGEQRRESATKRAAVDPHVGVSSE